MMWFIGADRQKLDRRILATTPSSASPSALPRERLELESRNDESDLNILSTLLAQIGEQARALNAEERAMLAETMLESLHSTNPEIQAAWDEEIASRLLAWDRGEMPSFSADEVFSEARLLTKPLESESDQF